MALAGRRRLAEVFDYRFEGGVDLRDQAVGNIIIATLTDISGGFCEGVRQAARLLTIIGSVYPAATESLTLVVRYADGTVTRGESAMAVLAPGSLFTSTTPMLGIRVRETRLLPKRMSVQVRHHPHRLARASAGWPDPLAVKPSIRPPGERRPARQLSFLARSFFSRRPSDRPSMSTSSRVVTTRSAPAAARLSASSARARPSAAMSPALAA